MLRVGETVGPYEILARLKAGGMATLFVGQKRGAAGFSRHVAIKVVHEHLASDEEFVRMFVDEALLQARIHHPNVVHVEELGETPHDGMPVHFLVMEYVYGCSLSQLLDSLARRDRRLSPEIAVHIAIQTLAGLHAAHELKDENGANLGVVHRDVSPQNVLLAYEGHVKLIDFGVAKARNRSQQTTGASIKGKIRYMPPEQAMGISAIDRRADVYALGIVLWEMLAFRKLFGAKDDLVLLDMVRNPKIVPPSHVAKDISPEIDRVVMKALAPKPEDRWATAQDFRRALAEAMPKAMLVDASHVADLLVAVMAEQIKKDREALPSQLSAVVANDARRDGMQVDEALHTMTVSAAGLAYLDGVAIDVEAPIEAPRPLAAPVVVIAGPTGMDAPAALLAPPPARPPLADTWRGDPAMGTPVKAPEAGASRLPILLGAVAVLCMMAAAGAWYVLRVRDQTVATSLSPEVAASTASGAVPVTPIAVPDTSSGVGTVPPDSVGTPPPLTGVGSPPPTTQASGTIRPSETQLVPPTVATVPDTESHPVASAHPTVPDTGSRPRLPPHGPHRPPRTTAPGGAVPLADEW